MAVSDAFRTRFDALSGQLRYLPRTGKLIWEATRGWSVAWVAILVLLGLSPLATVTLTKRLVDSIVAASALQRSIGSVHTYPFLTVVEKTAHPVEQLLALKRGTQWQSL